VCVQANTVFKLHSNLKLKLKLAGSLRLRLDTYMMLHSQIAIRTIL